MYGYNKPIAPRKIKKSWLFLYLRCSPELNRVNPLPKVLLCLGVTNGIHTR